MSLLGERFARTRHRLSYIPEAVVLISFLLLFVFFSFAAPHFLTAFSLGNILTFGSITGIVVIGVGMLMIAGEFDLSVGSNFALASYILPLVAARHWHRDPLGCRTGGQSFRRRAPVDRHRAGRILRCQGAHPRRADLGALGSRDAQGAVLHRKRPRAQTWRLFSSLITCTMCTWSQTVTPSSARGRMSALTARVNCLRRTSPT